MPTARLNRAEEDVTITPGDDGKVSARLEFLADAYRLWNHNLPFHGKRCRHEVRISYRTLFVKSRTPAVVDHGPFTCWRTPKLLRRHHERCPSLRRQDTRAARGGSSDRCNL